MQSNNGYNSSPELAIRRAVHALGLRYRVDSRPLPSKNRRADLVFRRAKVAVFVDGCFWHGCPEHFAQPKSNSEYWDRKIGRNIERDRETSELLAVEGWSVIRVWEHEAPSSAAGRIADLVRSRLAPQTARGG